MLSRPAPAQRARGAWAADGVSPPPASVAPAKPTAAEVALHARRAGGVHIRVWHMQRIRQKQGAAGQVVGTSGGTSLAHGPTGSWEGPTAGGINTGQARQRGQGLGTWGGSIQGDDAWEGAYGGSMAARRADQHDAPHNGCGCAVHAGEGGGGGVLSHKIAAGRGLQTASEWLVWFVEECRNRGRLTDSTHHAPQVRGKGAPAAGRSRMRRRRQRRLSGLQPRSGCGGGSLLGADHLQGLLRNRQLLVCGDDQQLRAGRGGVKRTARWGWGGATSGRSKREMRRAACGGGGTPGGGAALPLGHAACTIPTLTALLPLPPRPPPPPPDPPPPPHPPTLTRLSWVDTSAAPLAAAFLPPSSFTPANSMPLTNSARIGALFSPMPGRTRGKWACSRVSVSPGRMARNTARQPNRWWHSPRHSPPARAPAPRLLVPQPRPPTHQQRTR